MASGDFEVGARELRQHSTSMCSDYHLSADACEPSGLQGLQLFALLQLEGGVLELRSLFSLLQVGFEPNGRAVPAGRTLSFSQTPKHQESQN